MGKIMEAVFCVGYMITVVILGTKTVLAGNKNKNKEILWFGIMSLILVFGDAFHLVPRVLVAINPTKDYHVALGMGTFITSITMTIFYLIMYFVYSMRYHYSNQILMGTMICLTVIRIALCLFPQNDWTGDSPVLWGIYRNIPFVIIGAIMIVLYFKQREDQSFRFMWLAITLSFLFYLPVVLFADVHPMIGMFMLPKTCMYIWAVAMGYKIRNQKGNE